MKTFFSSLLMAILLAIPTTTKAQTDKVSTSPLSSEDSLQLAWMEFEYIHEMESFIIDYSRRAKMANPENIIWWSPQEQIYTQLFRLSELYYMSEMELDATANVWFEKFVALLNREPASMYYPFKRLADRAGIGIVNSPDSMVRFYQWSANTDADDAGIKHIIQFKTKNNEILAIEAKGDPTGLESDLLTFMTVHQIIPFDTEDGKIYLMEYEVGIPQDGISECLSAFILGENLYDLKYVPLFKVGKKLTSNVSVITTAFNYSKYNTYYDDGEVAPEDKWLLKYDQQKRTVSIKELDDSGYPTGKITTLKFDGKIFK